MRIENQIKLLTEKEKEVLEVIKSFSTDRFRPVDIIENTGLSRQVVYTILRIFTVSIFINKENFGCYRSNERLLKYFSSL